MCGDVAMNIDDNESGGDETSWKVLRKLIIAELERLDGEVKVLFDERFTAEEKVILRDMARQWLHWKWLRAQLKFWATVAAGLAAGVVLFRENIEKIWKWLFS